ncbi:hypothetical protein RRF57_005788 [Xylaria bambusicola]|uniref:Uncharacterized protein n=1 Tax=Xylaria bambusicola TaxID=326684 RepID=A0AAN7UIF3_9PEZI
MSKDVLGEADCPATHNHETIFAQTRAAPRFGTVEDIADVVLLVTSEKSRWVTAQWMSAMVVSPGLCKDAFEQCIVTVGDLYICRPI